MSLFKLTFDFVKFSRLSRLHIHSSRMESRGTSSGVTTERSYYDEMEEGADGQQLEQSMLQTEQ
ncbi:16393_t:CDS:1, partial [Funneliformis mosseae]